ncbi:F-box/LRR-repeat protein 4-like [Mizuhopecten yessoensis]|uniref:F-box/LRR-repeat protein 4 n=1 Tax=Mizuhopecten yessoensis TaxID=6573 RepID=A0A210PSH5_MIZYE|nr:F-box/LRR-repeat protein 4-like [Mizuhopecten yessoensis]OWF39443.1 F-box/LRR-repeat protein 4 [Mizuhopecten yessoensis]
MSKKLLSCFGRRKDRTSRVMASESIHAYSALPNSGNRECQQKPSLVSQFSKEVTDFSSQYGSETSISYTACNLAGRSNIYPTYGDFTQACVFRTYGPWWNEVPSSRKKFNKRQADFCSEDFIEVSFDIEVYPCKLEIWETYNPGAVVKIVACDSSSGSDVDSGKARWQTIWKGEPEECPPKSRIFSPPLTNPFFKTKLIRLELCSVKCHYYTELDCIVMYGSLQPFPDLEHLSLIQQMEEYKNYSEPDNYVYMITSLMNQISVDASSQGEALDGNSTIYENKEGTVPVLEPKGEEEEKEEEEEEEVEVEGDRVEELPIDTTAVTQDDTIVEDNGFFDLLPEEVIQVILSYLDLSSLINTCCTCRLLQKQCSDSLQYTELNLQPYWYKVDSSVLASFQSRCGHLHHLNLSWCGGRNNTVSTAAFDKFLRMCGQELSTLYLANCTFVNSDVMKCIANFCPKLKDLDIQGCSKIDGTDLLHLQKIPNLTRLNLYRSLVDTNSLVSLIKVFKNLEALNIGSCIRINNFDEVCLALGKNCKKLVSVDFWRSKTITGDGLVALAQGCPDLEELDIGWCPGLRSGSASLIQLVQTCTKLKKLFLTANRNVCDVDLMAISTHSRQLQQLDILGTREVTRDAVLRVLQNCPKLTMFDVSFCMSIDFSCVEAWKKEFPHVNIKKSCQH